MFGVQWRSVGGKVDIGGMDIVLITPRKYNSRYSLLNTFCDQLGEGASELGIRVNPSAESVAAETAGGRALALMVMFNMPANPQMLSAWVQNSGGGVAGTALIQWMVDHPLHTDARILDAVGGQSSYRFACVADDDLHLVQLRWPHVGRMRLWHGVPRSALCDEGKIEASHERSCERDIDVLVAGSIVTAGEVENLRQNVPESLRSNADDLAALRHAEPWLSFGQAYDQTMPAGLACSDPWALMSVIFRYVTAAVNRVRRVEMVRALEGLNVTVLGSAAWEGELGRGTRLVGEVAYSDLPGWMARAKVHVAMNPTQFVHGFSERLLLGLAGGAANVTDDRLWVRREFGECTKRYLSKGELRSGVEELLRDASARGRLGVAGRECIERGHLWVHRVGQMLEMLGVDMGESAKATA